VKHGFAAPDGTVKRLRSGKISGNDLAIHTGQIPTIAVRTYQRPDVVASGDQATQYGSTYEARRAGQ